MAISDTTAIVGASRDDDDGNNSGSAYLFDTETGFELTKLTADDAAAADRFGWSVAISGATAIVGAIWDDDTGSDSGSAYLFNIGSGKQIAKLGASDAAPFDQFGYSVAASEGHHIIGAPFKDDTGFDSNSGSGYLFDLPCLANPADVTGDGNLDFFDISAFLTEFSVQDPRADFNSDGSWDFFDISSFIAAFSKGCS